MNIMSFAEIMLFFTYLANWQIILSSSAVIAVLLALLRERRKFIFFVSSVFGGYAAYTALKLFFHRARPDETWALIHDSGYSFPSGHAAMSVIFYGLVAYFLISLLRRPLWKMSVIAAFFLLILVIGFSRIYLGVHWFSDILAGWFLGFSILVFMLPLFRKREKIFPETPASPLVSKRTIFFTVVSLGILEISFFTWFYLVHPLLY
jgi:undecaprenyl-diphosphatase